MNVGMIFSSRNKQFSGSKGAKQEWKEV